MDGRFEKKYMFMKGMNTDMTSDREEWKGKSVF